MTSIFPDNVLLPAGTGQADRRPSRSRIAAFVPITLAIIGVATILVGRVTVSEIAESEFLGGVDRLATGSVEAMPKVEPNAKPGTR